MSSTARSLSKETHELRRACFGDAEQRLSVARRLEAEVAADLDPELAERINCSIVRLVLETPESDYGNAYASRAANSGSWLRWSQQVTDAAEKSCLDCQLGVR